MLTICGFAVFYACAPPPSPAPSRADTTDDDDDDDKGKSNPTAPAGTTAATPPPPVDAGTAGQACTDPGSSRACATTCSGLERCIRQPTGALQWGACECNLLAITLPAGGRDCQQVGCPMDRPNPVGCRLTFQGNDGRGCVARVGSRVFLKEGDNCKLGGAAGTLYCSATPSTAPLDANNCPMDRTKPIYASSPDDCP